MDSWLQGELAVMLQTTGVQCTVALQPAAGQTVEDGGA